MENRIREWYIRRKGGTFVIRYICENCARMFVRPRRVDVEHGLAGGGVERWAVSPCCGDGFEPAACCTGCGGWIAEREQRCGLCPRCAGKAVERLWSILQGEFSAEEREVINEAWDGVPLTGRPAGRDIRGGKYDRV